MGALKAAAVRLGGCARGASRSSSSAKGFTATLPPQLNDPVAAMPGLGNPARGGSRRETPQTIERSSSTHVDLSNEMREVFDDRQPAEHVRSMPVDPRGLAAFEYDINEGVGSDRSPAS